MPWRRLQYALKTFWNCLEEVFPRRLEDVLKSSWRRLGKTSSRCLEDIFARSLEDVLKISWRCLGTTSWKRLENVMKMYDQDEYIGLDQNVLKTFSEDEDERRLQDVFIKTNFCWKSFGYTRVLIMPLILNMPGFWMYQSCQGYTGFRICLNNSWICLIMSGYVWICLNIYEYA